MSPPDRAAVRSSSGLQSFSPVESSAPVAVSTGRKWRLRRLAPLYCLTDLIAIVGSSQAVVLLWGNSTLVPPIRTLLMFAAAVLMSHAFFGLYAERRSLLKRPGAGTVLAANGAALVVFCGVVGLLPGTGPVPWVACGSILLLNTALAASLRTTLRLALRSAGADACRVILLGSNGLADRLAEFIDAERPEGLEIAQRMNYDAGNTELASALRGHVTRHDADMVVCVDEGASLNSIMEIIEESTSLGVSTTVVSERMRILSERAHRPAERFLQTPVAYFRAPPSWPIGRWISRVLSVVVASVALVALAPFLLVVALLVKLTSPGPVLFVQERIGMNHRPFRICKFRTMVNGADAAQQEVESLNESDGVLFKIRNDPRITPIGRFLRKYSIDELPQLFNVVRGNMALVGPRPLPHRDYNNYYEKWHYNRHVGQQGVTCLWQVSGRSDLDFETMCILDVYYLRNRTLRLDLEILLRTVCVVVCARGAC